MAPDNQNNNVTAARTEQQGAQRGSSAQAVNDGPPGTCPYHTQVLRMTQSTSTQGLSPMDRFLNEGPHEQYALFRRPDTGELSTYKGCLCGMLIQSHTQAREGDGSS
ncbi:uncharacterized protein K441DRAFT_681505 [Cenococcum geophilum 1.58]|uniref:uncharacterized protein n=1 Tax=Cenococcum geophilum 1.58 TaxID=794803 RepID=UPI00358F3454|nr:hypothetical protein K441DRAFT_681505 [Cenococcum geophilum 1.58]